MEEIYKEYSNYDFSTSEQYKDFKEKFPPEPNESQDNHKKRFYKSYINHDFDVNYKPKNNNTSTRASQNTNNSNNNNNTNRVNSQRPISQIKIPPILELIDYLLILLVIFPFIIFKLKYCVRLSFLYFIYRLYFAAGLPHFNLNYLTIIIHNTNFHYLVLCFVMWIMKKYRILIIMPIIIYISIYLIKGLNKYYPNKYFNIVINNDKSLNIFILVLEIFNSFFNILKYVLGYEKHFFKSIVFIAAYIQYLKFRYYGSEDMRNVMNKIWDYIERVKNDNNRNDFLRKVADIILKVCHFINGIGANGNFNFAFVNGSIMFCNIF